MLGIKPNTCIRSYDHSVKLSCSGSGLLVQKYVSTDCSGSWTTQTISTAIDRCTGSAWYTNPYLETPRSSIYSITCSADKSVSRLILHFPLSSVPSGSKIIGSFFSPEALLFFRVPVRLIIGMRPAMVNVNQRKSCSMRTRRSVFLTPLARS